MELITKQGFKQTEVGLIPEDWDFGVLGDLCSKITDGTHDTPKPISEGIPFLTAIHIKENKIHYQDCYFLPEEIHKEIYQRCNPEKNDVLMVNIGAGVGTTAVVEVDYEFSLKNVALLKASKKIDGSYLNNILIKRKRKILKDFIAGGAQPFLSLGQISKIQIPLPPTLTEQRAIATALSDVDELISSLDKLITKKKAIKQGAMQQLLVVKEGWTTKTIKEVALYRRGSFPQPYGLAKWYDDISGMPFVQVVDVNKNKKLKAETKQKISSEGAKMSVFVKKGSVILTIQGSIGRICITQYDAYVDRTLLIFESFKEDFNIYFFMISVWLKFQIEKEKAPGGIIKTITKEALSSFEISYPNREEQDRIAEILEDIENELNELEIQKIKYQNVKQGMMQELLTGKTRLV